MVFGLSKAVTQWVARGTILACLAATTVTYVSSQKTLLIDQDGQLSQVQFFGQTVGEALNAGNVILTENDQVYPADTDKIGNGDVITVRKASAQVTASRSDDFVREALEQTVTKELAVQIDGENIRTVTTAGTVGDVLMEMGVVLEEGDTLSVDPSTEAVTGMDVVVGRASTDSLSVTETIKFEVTERDDNSLLKGERKVVQKGKVGETVTTFKLDLVNGEESERTVLAHSVLAEPVEEIIAIGTKEKPKPPAPVRVTGKVDTSGDSTPVASGSVASPAQAKAIAKPMVAAKGWDDSQYTCLVSLWTRESNWRVTAGNKSSGAYGIPQSLPGSKMASAGPNWRTDATTQISWGLSYIQGRYGTPCGAWSHFLNKNWY